MKQIQKVDGLVSGMEKNLGQAGPVPDEPNAIKNHIEDIQVSAARRAAPAAAASVATAVDLRVLVSRPSKGLWRRRRAT